MFSSFTKSDKTLFPPLLIMSNVPTFVSCVYHHYVVSMFYYQVFFCRIFVFAQISGVQIFQLFVHFIYSGFFLMFSMFESPVQRGN